MRVILVIIGVLILLASGALWLNYQNEERVYQFCTQLSVGNRLSRVQQVNQEFNLVHKQSDNGQHEYSHKYSPLLPTYVCRIEVKAEKISALSFEVL